MPVSAEMTTFRHLINDTGIKNVEIPGFGTPDVVIAWGTKTNLDGVTPTPLSGMGFWANNSATARNQSCAYTHIDDDAATSNVSSTGAANRIFFTAAPAGVAEHHEVEVVGTLTDGIQINVLQSALERDLYFLFLKGGIANAGVDVFTLESGQGTYPLTFTPNAAICLSTGAFTLGKDKAAGGNLSMGAVDSSNTNVMFLYNEEDNLSFTNSTTGSYNAAAGVLNSLAQIELVTNGYNVTVVGSDTPQYVYGLFMELTDPADFAAGYTLLDNGGSPADFKITTGFQPSAIWACVGHQNAQLGVESANPSAWTNWVLSEQSQVSLSASSDSARSGASAASYYVSTTNWVGLNDGGLETYVSTSAAIETDGVLWADLSRSSFIPSYVPWFSFAAAQPVSTLSNVYLGGTAINDMKMGTAAVDALYLGSTKIF